MENLIINGLDVQTHGNSSNQPIVFIHGFPFDHTIWDNVIEGLKDLFYCITYDIRGFGNSDYGTGQYTMEYYVEDLENILSHLKLKKPIICGFSMGGYIALRLNEKQPHSLKALILANTTTTSDTDEGKLKRASSISNIDQNGLQPFLENFFSIAFSEEYRKKEPLKLQELQNRIIDFNSLGVKGGLLAMISRTDTTKSLQQTNIPVLLISGENDQLIPSSVMEKLAKEIKNSTYVTLNHSGHVGMLEAPQQFTTALKGFLKNLS